MNIKQNISGSNVISASNLNREVLTLAYDGSMGLGVTQPQGVLLNIKQNISVSRWPTFPKQYAQTRRFSSGRARSFVISPENNLVFFVRSISKSDLFDLISPYSHFHSNIRKILIVFHDSYLVFQLISFSLIPFAIFASKVSNL